MADPLPFWAWALSVAWPWLLGVALIDAAGRALWPWVYGLYASANAARRTP